MQIAVGAHTDAIASLSRSLVLGGFYPCGHAALCHAHATIGEVDTARRLLDELRSRVAQEFVSPFAIAVALTGLGEISDALGRSIAV